MVECEHWDRRERRFEDRGRTCSVWCCNHQQLPRTSLQTITSKYVLVPLSIIHIANDSCDVLPLKLELKWESTSFWLLSLSISAGDVFKLNVAHGKTYQLNLVNAALEVNYYFSIAHHPLTVVAVDASYVEPFMTDIVYLSPGQTADVLLWTNLTRGSYYMAASVFSIVPEKNLGFPHTTTTAILQYPASRPSAAPILPDLPAHNDTDTRENFISNLRSTPSVLQDSPVPLSIDRSLQFTVGYALEANNTCPPSALCQGVNHTRFSAAVNNISFDNPWNTSLLEAFFLNEPSDINSLGFLVCQYICTTTPAMCL